MHKWSINSNFAMPNRTPCCTKESLDFLITILLDWFVLEARWLMNIAARNLWIQISAFTKQADVELVVYRKKVMFHYDNTTSKKPDILYKHEVYVCHIPIRLQVYMSKYAPSYTFDVRHPHSIYIHLNTIINWVEVVANTVKTIGHLYYT